MFTKGKKWERLKKRGFKRGVAVLCIASLWLYSFSVARAETFTSGAIIYRETQGCLVVTGYDAANNPDGKLMIPRTVQKDNSNMQVMGIDSRVFEGQIFSSIDIKTNSGMSIGAYEFLNAKVTGDHPSVEISGDKINIIGAYSFSGTEIDCDVNIRTSVGHIKERAFKDAVINGTLNFEGSIDILGEYALSGLSVKRIHIPDTIVTIEDGALSNTKIKTWNFGSSLENLGSKVFEGCDSLTSIQLSTNNYVENVATDAFPDREGLVIIIPKGLTKLAKYHFENYQHLVFQVPEDLREDSVVFEYLKEHGLSYKIGENGAIMKPGEVQDPSVENTPTPEPTPEPTQAPTPTPKPTQAPTQKPTQAPTATPTPTSTPTPEPTATPTLAPTPEPTATPTQTPTLAPTSEPTATPTSEPTPKPTPKPTATPTPGKTEEKQEKQKSSTHYIKNVRYKLQGKNSVMVMGCKKKNVKQVKIPNTVIINKRLYKVVSIKKRAFAGHKHLKKVIIGNYVKKIEDEAFANCGNLEKIEFGTNVVSIGKKVLYQDKKLKKITFHGTKLKKIGKNTFFGVPGKVDIRAVKSKAKYYTKLIRSSKA